MSVKMDVQMTPRAMYDFLLYHTYSHLSGLIGAIFGVVVLGLGIRAMAQGDYTAGMMFSFCRSFSCYDTSHTEVKGEGAGKDNADVPKANHI